ncbi:MAG: phage tail protein [Chloroflexota bacterium]
MPIRAELRVTARGLKLLGKLSAGPTRARAVAQTAINSTLKRSKPKAVRAVRAQVALPRAYVDERMREIPATKDKLEGRLGTPKRGLLLSRFDFTERMLTRRRKRTVKGRGRKGDSYKARAGIRVKVKATSGKKLMPGAFLIRLRRGKELGTDVGIAIRRRGAKGRGNYKVRYGPSLSQVYSGVKDDLAPAAKQEFERTFRYLLTREFK